MNEEDFYITLPSNTDTKYQNTNSNFKIPLAETLMLDNQWEVGLTEIYIPNYIYNIFNPHNEIMTYNVDPNTPECNNRKIIIPEGKYAAADFKQVVNQHFEKTKHTFGNITIPCKHFMFNFNEYTKKMNFWLKGGTYLKIPSKKLQNYLGIDRTTLIADPRRDLSFIPAAHPCNFEDETVHLFVYTNIIRKTQIGNIFAPILRIVNLDEEETKKKDYLHRIYENPQYHNLSFKNINEIEIKLCNTEGDVVKFHQGNTIVGLHFKRKRKVQYVLN